MMLYLRKMGTDYSEFNPEADKMTNLENCRLRLEFIDKHGCRVVGDVSEASAAAPGKIHSALSYESHSGTYDYFSAKGYEIAWRYPYTKAGVLQFVNRFSAVRFTGVEIGDDAREIQYPEDVLQLEREYKDVERRDAYGELMQSIREAPVKWMWLNAHQLEQMTAGEFEKLTLTAARTWIEGRKNWNNLTPEIKAKCIAHIFGNPEKKTGGRCRLYEDHALFDSCAAANPLKDLRFMAQLVEIDPAFAYPLEECTPEQFARRISE